MNGWFKLHRRLLTEPLWLAEPFTCGQAWVDLIGLANHTNGIVRIRGNRVEVKRGQYGWSEVKLGERWKWSRGRVRRFLSELKSAGRIEQQKSTITSLISIVNYETYQGDDTADGTADGQQTDSRQYPNKKDKKEKKDKIKTFSSDSVEFGLAKLLLSLIRERHSQEKEPNLQAWAQEVDRMIRLDKRSPERIEQVIRWCQADATPRGPKGFCWAINIRSPEKLRERFDRLEEEMNCAAKRASPGPAQAPTPVVRDAGGLTPRQRALQGVQA